MQNKVIFTIPSARIKFVFGAGGRTIQHIKEKCQVFIFVDAGDDTSQVTIKGKTIEAIQHAKHIVETLAAEPNDWVLVHGHVHFDAEVLYDFIFRKNEITDLDFMNAFLRFEQLRAQVPQMSIFFRTMEQTTSNFFNPAIVLKQIAEIKQVPIDQTFEFYEHIVSNHGDTVRYGLDATIYTEFRIRDDKMEFLKHPIYAIQPFLPDPLKKRRLPTLPNVDDIPMLGFLPPLADMHKAALGRGPNFECPETWNEAHEQLFPRGGTMESRFQTKYLWCLLNQRYIV